MADIELIIKISEDYYNFIKRQIVDGITNPLKVCIANGTPFPTEKLHKLYLEASVAANTDEEDAFALGELSMIKKVYEILGKEEK